MCLTAFPPGRRYMTYITGDVPVGAYDSTRLANVGIGHGAPESRKA
jgi:hypothetical protein